MVDLHIFDFDGTLFYSPVADQDALAAAMMAADKKAAEVGESGGDIAAIVKKLHGQLRNPFASGGLGWYQSLSSLSPPALPQRPSEDEWFVMPILDHMRAIVDSRNALLKKQQQRLSGPDGETAATPAAMPLIYILTGRDMKFYDCIWTLLQQVGLDKEIEDVLLKPSETAGTVKYKLNQFFSLIQYHHPSQVFYYEDRVEQGGRLLEGIRVLEEMLYANGSGSAVRDGDEAERVGVVTFDVADDVSAPFLGQCAAGAATPLRDDELSKGNGATSSPATVPYHPQPHPVKLPQGELDNVVHRNPSLSSLAACLRLSSYPLLRESCYPIDRRTAFYTAAPTDAGAEDAATAAQSSAVRQAERWVEGTVDYWNTKQQRNGVRGRGRCGSFAAARPPTALKQKVTDRYDPCALRAAVTFPIPPPFLFLMVLVPSALCNRCARMLSSTQLLALVHTLEVERQKALEETGEASEVRMVANHRRVT